MGSKGSWREKGATVGHGRAAILHGRSFPHLAEPWPPPVAWSLVVRKIAVLSHHFNWIAEVNFLMNEAPQHLLTGGTDFELFEGNKCVAYGRVID